MNKTVLVNKFVRLRYEFDNPDYIAWQDLTDNFNEPSFYTKWEKWVKKTWEEISNIFNDNFTINNLYEILDKNNVKYHSYCAMD